VNYPGSGDFRGRHEASVWQQLNRILRALLCVAVALVLVSLFIPQHKRLALIRGEIDSLEAQVKEQKALLGRQSREVTLLKNDPVYLETIARDRLDVMKEGETIFRVETRPNAKRK
jgi:cell division protein FtsB